MNRQERIKLQRMHRRIRLVVEERRVAFAARAAEPAYDAEATMEIPPPSELGAVPQRAIGRVTVRRA